jgi:O-antigen ligase
VLLSLAFLLLLVELCHRSPRPGVCAWCGLMIISAIVTGQRAALIGLAATLGCTLIVVVGRPWKRRSSARLSHLLPVVALLLIPLGTVAALDARTSSGTSSVPVVSSITGSFTGVGKTQSANIRLRVWSLGRHLAEQRPLFGWGLGQNFNIFQDNGSEDPFTGGDFHDIAIDLTVTTGLAGFGLFLLALGSSLGSAFGTWRNARDSAYAAAALAAGIVLVQLVAKGLVESVTQKYRLALVFGLFVGVIAQAARSETAEIVEPQRSEPVWI